MLRELFKLSHEKRTMCVGPLSLFVFLLGSLWISLLATICVTTGVLKPRGTYVSENGLMHGSSLTELNGPHLEQIEFPKDGFEDLGFGEVKGALFRSFSASDRRESLCLVAQEGRGDDILIGLAHALQGAKWLSKDVIFVILPQ